MVDHPMMNEQLRLEEEMRSVTRDRYFSSHEKAEERGELSDTHAGKNVMDFLYTPFLEGLNEWSHEDNMGKAGRRAGVRKMIADFGDNETMAYILIKHVINTTLILSKRSNGNAARLTSVALACAGAIHDELRMRYFAKNRKALLKKIIKDFQQRELPRRRRRDLMMKQFHTQQIEWVAPGWEQTERLKLGIVLLDIFKRSTGAVEDVVIYEGIKKTNCIAFSKDLVKQIEERMDTSADMFTVFYPMVVPPKAWSNDALIGGSYYSENVHPYRFVKGAKIKYLSELENRDMSSVLDPINALQNTAWRINPIMVNVLDNVYSRSLNVPGLPTADPVEIPPVPAGIDEDEQIKADYRRDCYIVHDRNRRMISKRISVLRTLQLASRFAKYDAIYFPYDLDSRGRAYPKPAFLNPQGPDYVKSLLEFSEGKPIDTEEQAAYLAVAVANAWGQDKLPLQDRVTWVEDNEEMLCEIARDPENDLRWLQADEPFMALRGALEWLGFCDYGFGYMSHMPVHFDATCSGLQHFSALLLDAEGGFHVNLTGCAERQDIYAAVAKKAEASLRQDTSDIARVALDLGISRSLCKRPVMIVPYAGTFSSCMEYVNDHYRERAEAGEELPLSMAEISKQVTPLVSKHVWSAISDTVIAARHAMDWITSTARLASKDLKEPLQWTTPDGFVIQQARYEVEEKRVNTYLDGRGGRRIRASLMVDKPNLDSKKMAQSLSPNYIHSLDACHMRGAIRKAEEIGGMSYAMIHDSFGVHAADMPVFVEKCIKPAFVEMYEGTNLLARFRDEILLNVKPEKLGDVAPLPPMGNLDIHEVNDSQFFFS